MAMNTDDVRKQRAKERYAKAWKSLSMVKGIPEEKAKMENLLADLQKQIGSDWDEFSSTLPKW